jgi:hypothetical protein
MKYMIMTNTAHDGYDRYAKLPKDVLAANIAFMRDFVRKLQASGELVTTVGLGTPARAKLVRSGESAPITDGVFPESKEFLAGFWVVDVESPERAYELAAEVSTAPGADEGSWIEVREVIDSYREIA